jgi:flagellar protein FlaG
LVIEEDQATGSLVYKTIDRRTGEVVLQLPREDIEKLGEETEYQAGFVIRAKA